MLKRFVAFQKAKELYWVCKKLKVSYPLHDQLLRASSSVALNLAEGSGKQTDKEKRRYYTVALASLRECEGILQLERIDDPSLLETIDHLGAILYRLTHQTIPSSGTGPDDANSSETFPESDSETQTAQRNGIRKISSGT